VSSDAQAVGELISRIAPALVAAPDRVSDFWDLDQIFWQDYPKPWNIERAMRCFTAVVDSYSPWSEQLLATLQIWLQQTPVLLTEAPDLGSVASLDVNPYHPPGIGLSKKSRPVRIYETYRVPVSQQLVSTPDGHVRAYYECFRNLAEQAANEPYDRILVIQHST
jgi:hypothetical protein